MLGTLNSRKRPPAGSELVRDVVRTPRPSTQPRRVWRLSDPNALQKLTGRVAQPTPVPWVDSDERLAAVQSSIRQLPDLTASIPDTDEIMATRQLPAVAPAVPTPTPTPPITTVRRADVRARFEAIPDLNQLVQGEVDARVRLQRDVHEALLAAVAKLQPELRKKPTSPVAWLLLGLSLGGMLVFFMLGPNQAPPAPPSTIVAAAPPPTAPPVCVAPEIAPVSTVVASVDGAQFLQTPMIPTFTVDALPKPKPKAVWIAPRRTATPAATAAIAQDTESDNPYDDMKDDVPTQ